MVIYYVELRAGYRLVCKYTMLWYVNEYTMLYSELNDFPKATAASNVGQFNTTTYISEMAAAYNVCQLNTTTYIS